MHSLQNWDAVAFEVLFGRYVAHLSWERLRSDYALLQGGLMSNFDGSVPRVGSHRAWLNLEASASPANAENPTEIAFPDRHSQQKLQISPNHKADIDGIVTDDSDG